MSASRLIELAKRFWYLPVLIGYAELVGWLAAHHEPWLDEAQAWLIARDSGFCELFTQTLRYEGHPALWYLVLKAAVWCHLPYAALGALSAVIASLGVAVLLMASPMPKWLAALWPFTFFLCYQYAVVARSYVLLPLLLFVTACALRRRWQRPIWLSLALILLANVSVHAFLMACGILALHVLSVLRQWPRLDAVQKRRQGAAVAVFAVVAMAVVAMLWPAADCVTKTGLNGSLAFDAQALQTLAAIDGSLFECVPLSVLLLVVSCYWFWRTGVFWLFLAVWTPVVAVFFLLVVYEHHQGLLLLAWLFAFWCSLDAYRAMRDAGTVDRRLRVAFGLMLLLCTGLVGRQIVWTVDAAAHEIALPYCGAQAAADFLKTHHMTGCRIAGDRNLIGAIEPYFSHNIFINFPNPQNRSYVDWRRESHALDQMFSDDGALQKPCDAILWSNTFPIGVAWTEPAFLAGLPSRWRCVGYFDGLGVYKDRFPYRFGFAVLATRDTAARFKLPDVARPTSEVEPAPSQHRSRPKDYVSWASNYWELGRALRKIDPHAAAELYQSVLNVRLPPQGGDSPCSLEEQRAALKHLQSAAHNALGTTQLHDHPREALAHFQAAIQLDPDVPAFHLNAAVLLMTQNRRADAQRSLERVLELDPENPTAPKLLQKLSK